MINRITLLLLFIGLGFSTTINIPSDYSTIQEGINISEDGDTVLVQPGTYIENNILIEGKNIFLLSTYYTTLNNDIIDSTIIDGNNWDIIKVEDSECFIGGFTITGATSGRAFEQDGYDEVTIANSIIRDNRTGIRGNNKLLVYRVLLFNNETGLSCSSSNPIMNKVTITNNDYGIYARSSSPGFFNYIFVTNSIIWGNEIAIDVTANHEVVILYSNLQNGSSSPYAGVGTIEMNPDFNNSETNDFTLHENSPCIDYGSPLVIYNDDTLTTLNENEYIGFSPDMGYDEQEQNYLPEPVISDISDVPNDGGGFVNITFERSFYDKDSFNRNTESYVIERQDTINSEPVWVNISSGSAYNSESYTYYVSTIYDSNIPTHFRVIANMDEGTWVSASAYGYSINNYLSLDGENQPTLFNLHQNYPNPFNPVTTLQYDLPKDGLVNITVYDMLGNVVNNLVNANQSSGYKSIQWNATNNQGEPVSAGLYLYTIQAGQFRQTKKMVLLK
jgi:hypothetical protein